MLKNALFEDAKTKVRDMIFRTLLQDQTQSAMTAELELRTIGDPGAIISQVRHAVSHYPFGVDISYGLWVARNRALVVSTLEQAMSDPQQPIGPVGSVLQMAVALKSRLESPYDPTSTNPLPQVNQIEDDYVRRIAATLPLRKDANLASTAITLLTSLAQRGKSGRTEFEAAREAIITHFADVNEYQKRQWKSWKGPFGQRSWTQMDPSCFESIFGPTQERDKWRVSL